MQVPQPPGREHRGRGVEGGGGGAAVRDARGGGEQVVGDRAETPRQASPHLLRSDNCVKNHFYSRLRKALRRLARLAEEAFPQEFRPLKMSHLSRIVETADSRFKLNSPIDEEQADFCTCTPPPTQPSRADSSASNCPRARPSERRNWRKRGSCWRTWRVSRGRVAGTGRGGSGPRRASIEATSNHRLPDCGDSPPAIRGVLTTGPPSCPPPASSLPAATSASTTVPPPSLLVVAPSQAPTQPSPRPSPRNH